jgi:hypothetical protein
VVFLVLTAGCTLAPWWTPGRDSRRWGCRRAEGLNETVSVFWADDNASYTVFSLFSVSWWGVATGALAAVLVVTTHLVILRRART